MKASTRPNPRTHSLILTPRDEEMLRAIYQYRYMTSLDMAHLLFNPSYLSYVRGRLARLAYQKDLATNSYLVRLSLPQHGAGNQLRVFALGAKGAKYLEREVGMPVDFYFKPSKYRDLGISHLRHSLLLTRLAVSAAYWSRTSSQYTLTQTRLSYELGRSSAKVIPDAFLLFEDKNGKKYPTMIEIDRGMEYKEKFKRHVKARIDFIYSGEYSNFFNGLKSVVVAYATTGQRPEYRESRQANMSTWIREACEEVGKSKWSGIFRVTSFVPVESMYDHSLFEKAVWFRPDSAELVPLLPPA